MIKVTLYVPAAMWKRLQELSARTGAPVAHYVRTAIDAVLLKRR